MSINARTLSRTALFIWSSSRFASLGLAIVGVFLLGLAVLVVLGYSPVRADVRSSIGSGGQSSRPQDGPDASAKASTLASPSSLKNLDHCSSTDSGFVA